MRNSTLLAAAATLLLSAHTAAQQVTIIESLTGNTWAVQDSVWYAVATDMGYTATVVPQTALDDLSNFSGTDVLVVSSSNVPFGGTNHLLTIAQYMLNGGPVYIQSEYQTTFQGNITFDSVMTAVGADFTWLGTVSGSLVPTIISGDLSTTPNAVSALNYFNYGCAGEGADVESFLSFGGSDLGWVYDDSTGPNGMVITASDEDWAWQNASPELMENILYKLANSGPTSVQEPEAVAGPSVFPNPCASELTVSMGTDGPCELILRDIGGRELLRRAFTTLLSLDVNGLCAGAYLYEVRDRDGVVTKGRVLKE